MIGLVEPARLFGSAAARGGALRVVHVIDAYASAGPALWGKERVVRSLMRAQRASGAVEPSLVSFTPCPLAHQMAAEGFNVSTLEPSHSAIPARSLLALRRALSVRGGCVVHTHGYKANVVTRLARASGTSIPALVSTCHGWGIETARARLYNELDRRTAPLSDVTTVASESMLGRFGASARVRFIANAIPDQAPADAQQRREARARFGFPEDRIVIGVLGRTSAAKGLPDVLAAAASTFDRPFVWAVAGVGEDGKPPGQDPPPNVRFLGYVSDTASYLAALDLYVQASHAEGLSLALLEAMRAERAIVATDTGSTAFAVRDGNEGLLIRPGDVRGLVGAVDRVASDETLRSRLGAAARARFADAFRIERQHEAFLALYRLPAGAA